MSPQESEKLLNDFFSWLEQEGMCIAGYIPYSPIFSGLRPLHEDDKPNVIKAFLSREQQNGN